MLPLRCNVLVDAVGMVGSSLRILEPCGRVPPPTIAPLLMPAFCSSIFVLQSADMDFLGTVDVELAMPPAVGSDSSA